MLFSYDKAKGATQGFRSGFGMGGISFGDIGANKKILDSGNNRKFLDTLEYAQKGNRIPEGQFDAFADELAKKLPDVDEKMVKLAKDTQTTQGSVIGLTKTFENQTSVTGKLGTSIKNVSGTLLASLGNAVVSFAASAAFSMVVQGIQNWINSYELLAQKTQEIASKYNQQKSQLNEYSTELIKLNAVINDESSSTEEVKNATSQLYEIQNDLIGQYGSYHAGIDLVNSDLESQLDLLQKINQENSQRALNDINAQKSNRVKGSNALMGLLQQNAILPGAGGAALSSYKFLQNYFGQDKGFKRSLSDTVFDSDLFGQDVGTDIYKSSSTQIKQMVEDYNESFETTNETVLRLAKNYKDAFEVNGNTITAKGNINDVNDAIVQLQLQLQSLGVEDEKVFSSLGDMASETSERMSTYGESYNTIIEGEVQTTGYLAKYYRDLTDKRNEFLEAQATGDTDEVERLGKEYQEMFASIANTDIDKSYLDYFKNLYPELENYISQWEFDVKVIPRIEKHVGLGDDIKTHSSEDLISRYRNYVANPDAVDAVTRGRFNEIERAAADADMSVEELIVAIKSIPEYSDEMQHVRDLMGENFTEEFGKELSDADLEALVSIKPKKDGLAYTKEEIEKLLSPVEVDAKVNIKSSDAVNSMADMKKAVGSLDDLYGQIVKGVTSEGLANGFADPDLLNNVESSFYKFSEELKKEGNDAAANEINLALEKFEDTLVKFPNDAEKAQASIDELITAYIDQTDVIKNLTEENAEWSTAQLKAMGITNAEEVVQSRLSAQIKETQEALSDLSKELLKYNDALNGTDEEAKADAIANLVSPTRDALANRDKSGKILEGQQNAFLDNIDDSFVQAHLADIQAMAEGDIDALNRVRMAAAKGAVMEVTTNIPTEAAEAQIRGLMDMVAQADAMNIEPGASINDASFYDHLNQMVRSGQVTVDQVNAAFSAMGYEARWKSNRSIVRVPNGAHVTTVYGGPNAGQAIHWDFKNETVDFPSLDIITKKGGSGGGATAHYSGSPSKSSGGGGGGGGGGGNSGGSSSSSEPTKPQEEATDTFDWIEVAIQRIEEEINRLDEVVNNSYTTWAKRNSALVKELDKTKKEIQAQFIAQQEYQHYLKTIKINNGKGLNADDYGENDQLVKQRDQKLLDEAKRLWATGQYQKKIQNGQMTGNDIEKIQNHFLVDAINEYQEYTQKAIEAGDAVETLKIKLGELARTNFDNVAKQFEETQQYFESTADLIDERINRTEEKGYFVSRKYYDNLITNETKNINSLKSEYNKLVAARDDAVKNGYVVAQSEEWHSMNQEILSVASSIESATTELVKFNNEIRQLSWDVFDYTRDRIEKVTDEFEFLIDLLDNQKLYDDYGMFNSRGWADTALHASKYNTYMQQALDYANERAKIEKELAKDKANKNLIERREELIQLQQESIKNSYAEKEAIRDLVQEAINIHLSKLSELIDEYKKAMHDARDLYNYQKNIAEQTKNLGNIQKQLEAYQGDDSEETRATIQKLQDNLRKAQEQLQETEWDKYISETETFLSDMYDEYEETLNARLDDIDLLVHDLIDDINARGTEIKDIISQVSDEVAYNLTSSANTVLNNGTIVSDFKTSFETYATTTQAMINDIRNYISGIGNQTVAEAINTGNIQSAPAAKSTPVNTTNIAYKNNNSMEVASKNNSTNVATTTSSSSTKSSTPNYHTMTSRVQLASTVRDGIDWSPVFDVNYYKNRYPDLQKAFGNNYAAYLDHFLNYGMKEGRQASDTFDVKYYKNKYPDLQKAYGNNLGQYYRHFIIYGIKEGRQGSATFNVQTYKKLYGDLQKAYGNNLKQYYSHYNLWGAGENRKHYATGTSHASNEIAWTNEGALYGKGGEVIYRKSDGAILTPLHNGDKVFTAQMSDNLWNLAKLNLKPTSVPTGTAVKTVNNVNEISITLPNVSNYDEFKTQLKNDPNMANFIQEITLGEVSTGVKLNKRKL